MSAGVTAVDPHQALARISHRFPARQLPEASDRGGASRRYGGSLRHRKVPAFGAQAPLTLSTVLTSSPTVGDPLNGPTHRDFEQNDVMCGLDN